MSGKMKKPYLWEELSVDEIRGLIKAGCRTVLVPVGVTEQHGYHLSTFTDCHLAREISVRAAAKSECLMAPLLPYLFSGGLLPGTINVSLEAVTLMLGDIADSLYAQGIDNVLFILGHGGSENFKALQNFQHLYFHKRPHLADKLLSVVPTWEFSKTWMKMFVKNRDYHAGEFETALMMELAPATVRLKKRAIDASEVTEKMRNDPDYYQLVEKALDHGMVAPHVSQKPEIKVGVMGDPFKANRKLGRKLVDETVAGLVKFIEQINAREVGKRQEVSLVRQSIFGDK